MPVYQIPATATRFEIARAKDGAFLVVSDTRGTVGVAIPCRDEARAIDVCGRLNRREHDGTVDVPLFGWPPDGTCVDRSPMRGDRPETNASADVS